VKEPYLFFARSVEHPDCLACRLQPDLATVLLKIGFGFRRQMHIAHLAGADDDLLASVFEKEFCLVL